MTDPLSAIVSLDEFEARAKDVMSHMAFEYVASGAADEHSLRWNAEAYARIKLRPRVLVDVAHLDTSVQMFGATHSLPILLAPTAYQKAVHADAELGTTRGAGAAGVTYVVSTATNTSLDDIAKVATSPLWFQLYIQSDRDFTFDLVRRAEAAGCKALCLTVDTPVLGARNRQARAGFQMPPDVAMPHLYDMSRHAPGVITPERVSLLWDSVDWLKSVTKLPLLLKGILDPRDAEIGIQHGADGIIVSNHGARNLDTVPATIDALPAVAEAVSGRVPVLVDGGIRRGTDVLKAIALGANAALIGRPHCYGLAVGGAAGVQRVVEILAEEVRMAMMLTGRRTIASIDRTVLWD